MERRAAGWTYGPTRDDVLKRNPWLKPWSELSDDERGANRAVAQRIPEILARENLGLVKELNMTLEQFKSCSTVEMCGRPTVTILSVDPLSELELSAADAACTNRTTRVRLYWKGASQLAEIERRLALYPVLA